MKVQSWSDSYRALG